MKIKVGISGDLLNSNGIPCFGNKALSKIKTRSDIEITWMDKSIKEITEEMASKFDAILLNIPKASAKSVSRDDCKLKIISRFGVGYDSVDIEAMKEKGIVVTNTPNAVRRPVAVAKVLSAVRTMAINKYFIFNKRTEFSTFYCRLCNHKIV